MNNIDWGNIAAVCAIILFLGGVIRYMVRAEMEKFSKQFKKDIEEAFGKKFDRIFRLLDEWQKTEPRLMTKEECKENMEKSPANIHATDAMMSALNKG
jgi:hypothetical protein